MLAGLFAFLAPSLAHAHADLDPLHDHRIFSAHLTDSGVVVGYVLAFSAATSEELRREADANHDGRIGRDEEAALVARSATFARGLSANLDGAPIAFDDLEPKIEGAEGDVGGLREIAVRWERRIVPKAAGEHRLKIADGTKLARPGDLHVRVSGEGQSRVLGIDHRVESRLGFLEAAFHRQDTCQSSQCEVEVRFLGGGVAPTVSSRWLGGLALSILGGVPLVWYALRGRRKDPSAPSPE